MADVTKATAEHGVFGIGIVAGLRRGSQGGDVLAAAADEIEMLRRTLTELRRWLSKPDWGTYRYMEGAEVYEDKERALSDIAHALGEKPSAE